MSKPCVGTCRGGKHAWVEENIYTTPAGDRTCRECQKAASRRYYAKRRATRTPRHCGCGRRMEPHKRTCGVCRSARGSDSYSIRDSDRAYIYKRDGHKCLKCGASDRLAIDHILPRALGGADHRSNYQTLCMPCNVEKGATYADYRPESTGQLALALEPPRPTLRNRFMDKIEVQDDGCWGWTGARVSTGNGAMMVEGRLETAARVAWLLEHDEMPSDRLFRTCGQDCVNPEHLTTEHLQRREGGFCRNGHEMTPENTIRRKGKGRRCRTCRRAYMRERNRKKKQLQHA